MLTYLHSIIMSLHYTNVSILDYAVIMLAYHNYIPSHYGNVITVLYIGKHGCCVYMYIYMY